MPQTSVSTTIDRATAGLIADSGYDKNVRSYANTEASAEIPFGVACAQDPANDAGCKLLAAITDEVAGIAVRSHAYDASVEMGTIGLKPGATVGLMTHGRIWVPVEGAVTPNSAVHVRAVAAGVEQAGAFRATADGTDTIDVSKFCRFMTTTAGAGLAQLEIDVTNRNA